MSGGEETAGGDANPAFDPSGDCGHCTGQHQNRKVSVLSDEAMERKVSTNSVPKSILVNGEHFTHHHHEHPRSLSISTVDRRHSLNYDRDTIENSWWFILCTKCRQKETGPGWEPTYWQSVCPYPFCPTYRHVARVLALLLLVLLSWGVIYAILGSESAPGGQLFDIIILCVCAHIGGWACRMIAMPGLVGMLIVGIVFQNAGFINVHGGYSDLVKEIRKIALVIILTRAGLDLDSEAMKRLWSQVLKIGLIPWISEAGVVLLLTHYFMGLPWMWGVLTGSIVAAVSPAVVVPCLFRLRNKGYGVAKGIPTLIIAVAGMDDAASVAAFGIVQGIMFTSATLVYEILLGPISILAGIGYGVLVGALANYVPEKEDPFVVPLRLLLLLGGGLIAVLGSELVGLGGAGPLACMVAAFLCIYFWGKQGWDVEDNPVATAFEIFWMICEPVLFGLTGTQIKFKEMEVNKVLICAGILFAGIVFRIMVTVGVSFGAKLNTREKLFVALSLMAKASVQAALGPVALDMVRDKGGDEEEWAQTVSLVCVMSILMAAPTGAILIMATGSRLLSKTTVPVVPDGWRRSARPSLRDITITEEEEDDFKDNESVITKSHRPSIIIEQPRN